MICTYAYLCNLQKCENCSFPECSHTTDEKYRHFSKSPTEMRHIGSSDGVDYYMEYAITENKNG